MAMLKEKIVLFGDSITDQSFRTNGWGASLANAYTRRADVVVRGFGGYNTRWAMFLLNHLFPLGSAEPPLATTIFFGANDAALLGRTSERQHVPIEEYKENLRKIVLHLKGDIFSIEYVLGSIFSVFYPSYLLFYLHFPANGWLNYQSNAVILGPAGSNAHCNILYKDDNNNSIIPLGEAVYKDHVIPLDLECSPTMQIVLITPPPVCEEGRLAYAKSLYGENATKVSERTNEVTGEYANACVETAKEMGLHYINLWSKMQETDGWGKKFLSDGLHLTPEGNEVVFQEVIKVFNEAGLSVDGLQFHFPHHSKIDPKNPESAFQQNVCPSTL